MITKNKRVSWEDINVKAGIFYMLFIIAVILLYIAFVN